jgi:peptide chain release factor 1
LQLAEVDGERRLVADRGGHAPEEGGHFRTGLGETKNIVDEDQNVLLLFVPEVLSNGQRRKRDTRARPGRFGHLPIDQCRLWENPGSLHLVIQVVAFTGALAHAREDGYAFMLLGDVVHHLHHDDRLAHAGAAEHAHFAAAGEGHQQVDDLDAGLQHAHGGVLVRKRRCGFVNRSNNCAADGVAIDPVHRLPDDVDHPPQGGLAHRNHDRVAGVLHGHAPHQAVGDVHGDGAHDVVAQVLGHLDDQVVRLIVDGRVGDGQRRVDRRQLALREFHVDDRAHDLHYFTEVLSH